MSKKNKIIIFGAILILAILAGFIFFFITRNKNSSDNSQELNLLREKYPNFVSFVDEIEKENVNMKSDPELIKNYLALGMAWKSLADRTLAAEHYKKALEIYQQGIEKTGGKNTLFLMNAGHMAEYLKDYNSAESYYKKAIEVSPGESEYYITLAELYEYKMKKSKDEIIALYDAGLKRVLDRKTLENSKKYFLEK